MFWVLFFHIIYYLIVLILADLYYFTHFSSDISFCVVYIYTLDKFHVYKTCICTYNLFFFNLYYLLKILSDQNHLHVILISAVQFYLVNKFLSFHSFFKQSFTSLCVVFLQIKFCVVLKRHFRYLLIFFFVAEKCLFFRFMKFPPTLKAYILSMQFIEMTHGFFFCFFFLNYSLPHSFDLNRFLLFYSCIKTCIYTYNLFNLYHLLKILRVFKIIYIKYLVILVTADFCCIY